jgi:hypothetical protein
MCVAETSFNARVNRHRLHSPFIFVTGIQRLIDLTQKIENGGDAAITRGRDQIAPNILLCEARFFLSCTRLDHPIARPLAPSCPFDHLNFGGIEIKQVADVEVEFGLRHTNIVVE